MDPRRPSLAMLPLALVVLLTGCAGSPDVAGDDPASQGSAATVGVHLPSRSELPALRAAFLIVDGVYNSELMAPYDIFHHTRFHTKPHPWIEVFTVSPSGDPLVTFEGLMLTPHHSLREELEIDILVVPSAEGSMDRDLENQEMMDWVREVGQRARYVISLCDGAFVLAAAGLLDGHSVTTFPGDQDRFAEMFPHLDLRREPGFVHDGKVLTSQGGAKSYDLAMYLVDHLYGENVARGVGRGLIIPWPPPTPQGITITSPSERKRP